MGEKELEFSEKIPFRADMNAVVVKEREARCFAGEGQRYFGGLRKLHLLGGGGL